MRRAFLAVVVLLAFVLIDASATGAQQKDSGEAGRYQVYFHPRDPEVVYLVDTREGRVWRSALDTKINLRYWRPMPVEGLDYPIQSYPKAATDVLFKNPRGLSLTK